MTISNLLSNLINKTLAPKTYEDLSSYYRAINQINESEAFELILQDIINTNIQYAPDNSTPVDERQSVHNP